VEATNAGCFDAKAAYLAEAEENIIRHLQRLLKNRTDDINSCIAPAFKERACMLVLPRQRKTPTSRRFFLVITFE